MRPTLATFGTPSPPGSPVSEYRLGDQLRKTPYHRRERDATSGKRQVLLDRTVSPLGRVYPSEQSPNSHGLQQLTAFESDIRPSTSAAGIGPHCPIADLDEEGQDRPSWGGDPTFPISPACDAHALTADLRTSAARMAARRRVWLTTPRPSPGAGRKVRDLYVPDFEAARWVKLQQG